MKENKQINEEVIESNSDNKINYANFWDRLIARVIDIILTSIVGYLIISKKLDDIPNIQRVPLIIFTGISIFHILYSPIMESFGGTFGKKVAKIRTINIHTNKVPSIAQTIKRSAIIVVPMLIVLILNVFYKAMTPMPPNPASMGNSENLTFMSLPVLIVYLLPFLAMLWSPTKQCWHDKFSKIAVIKMIN